jgi:hypothetical protein
MLALPQARKLENGQFGANSTRFTDLTSTWSQHVTTPSFVRDSPFTNEQKRVFWGDMAIGRGKLTVSDFPIRLEGHWKRLR